VECGAYEADLPLWEELAEATDGPALELGCGTGRVALHLARRGHKVVGIDRDADLIAELRERAAAEGADDWRRGRPMLRDSHSTRNFGLIVAPMQLIQLLPDTDSRRELPDGRRPRIWPPTAVIALAIVETGDDERAPLPPSPRRPRSATVGSTRACPSGAIREGDSLLVERLRPGPSIRTVIWRRATTLSAYRCSPRRKLEGRRSRRGPQPRRPASHRAHRRPCRLHRRLLGGLRWSCACWPSIRSR